MFNSMNLIKKKKKHDCTNHMVGLILVGWWRVWNSTS